AMLVDASNMLASRQFARQADERSHMKGCGLQSRSWRRGRPGRWALFELAKQEESPMLVGCLSTLCSHASSYQFAPGSFSVSSCSFSSAAALLFQDRMTGSRRLAVALVIRKCRQAPRAPAACTA